MSNQIDAVLFQTPSGAPYFVAAADGEIVIPADSGDVVIVVSAGDAIRAGNQQVEDGVTTGEPLSQAAAQGFPLGTAAVTGPFRFEDSPILPVNSNVQDPALQTQHVGIGATPHNVPSSVPGAYVSPPGKVTVYDAQNPVRFAVSALQLTNDQGENAPIPDGPLSRSLGAFEDVEAPAETFRSGKMVYASVNNVVFSRSI